MTVSTAVLQCESHRPMHRSTMETFFKAAAAQTLETIPSHPSILRSVIFSRCKAPTSYLHMVVNLLHYCSKSSSVAWKKRLRNYPRNRTTTPTAQLTGRFVDLCCCILCTTAHIYTCIVQHGWIIETASARGCLAS